MASKSQKSAAVSRLPIFSTLIIAVCSAAVFFGNLRFGKDVVAIGLEDDFFYYSQVARNLAFHGTSSFDGIHQTNGYHPLWLLAVTALTKLFDIGGLLHASTIFPFFISLEVVQLLLVLSIAFFTWKICSLSCSFGLNCCIQMLAASSAIILVRSGMEVGLTLVLAFALLWFRLRPSFQWSISSSFAYGTLASLLVLSRLDSILLVGLLFLFDLLMQGPERRKLQSILTFGVATWPIALYLAINKLYFHTLTPISGTAKQLRHHHLPTVRVLHSLIGGFTAKSSPLLLPCVFVTIVALVLHWRTRRGIAASANGGVVTAALIFPFLQIAAVATLSDWPLWPWYFYPWLISAVVATASLAARRVAAPVNASRENIYFAIAAVYIVFYSAAIYHFSAPEHDLPYQAALDIRQFSDSHPGVYAMGDRAGSVGYLIDQPLIQLEGLVMDKEFLNHIRKQDNLVDVLRQYHVRYYVSTRSSPDADGCYAVKEPYQAGPDSPSMHARICKTPVAVIQHHEFVNDIFDMDGPDMH